jgi:phosphate-selective porin OprO and OprP
MPGWTPRPLTPPPAGGFFAQTDDMRFVYRMSGFVHLEADSFGVRDQEKVRQESVVGVRRSRGIAEGTLFGILDARVMFDLAMDVVPLDAYVDLRAHRAANLRVGKFKSPFGFERLAQVFAVPFTERALPTRLAPNRDFGVYLHGQSRSRTLGYEVAVLGGAEDLGIQHFYSGKPDFAGRVFVMPFGERGPEPLRNLGAGFSTTLGESSEREGLKLRWSVHGHYQYGRLGAWLDYVETRDGLAADVPTQNLVRRAWVLQTSVALTDDENDFFGIKPRRPFAPRQGHFGAFALALRVHELRGDDRTPVTDETTQDAASTARAGGAALLWKLNHSLETRLDLEYTRRHEPAATSSSTIDELAVRARLEARF